MKISQLELTWSSRNIQVLCGLVILLIWIAPVPKLRLSHINTSTDIQALALPKDASATNMAELIQRPIFSQTRRPQPAPQVALKVPVIPKIPAPTTDGMVLLGILHVGTKAVALVTSPGDVSPKQVIKGSMIGSWQVMDILTDRLILRSGQTRGALIIPTPSKPGASQSQNSTGSFRPSSQGSLPFFGAQ